MYIYLQVEKTIFRKTMPQSLITGHSFADTKNENLIHSSE